MLNLALLGGGGHSYHNHLPALQRYASLHPGEIRLAACCDLRPEIAARMASEFGFATAYTDLDAMLAAERLDGCIAVTPIAATAAVAATVMRAGLPLLMEKPPGATPAETDALCDLARQLGSRVMVSVNRRFEATVAAARTWAAEHPLRHLHGSMWRHNRREETFATDTAIHCLDVVCSLGGPLRSGTGRVRRVDGVWWYHAELEFAGGATGTVEILPTCGAQGETYDLFAADGRALARIGEVDDGTLSVWQDGVLCRRETPGHGQPPFVQNGTLAETAAFIAALREGRAPWPGPEDVRPALRLTHRLRQLAESPAAQAAGEASGPLC